jgi:hypothetical protein
MRNVAADHPDVVDRLTHLHDQWLVDVVKQ